MATDPNEIIQYFAVDEDLGMSPGKIGAQTAHGATLATAWLMDESSGAAPDQRQLFKEWLACDMKKIVLRASPAEMLLLAAMTGAFPVRDNGHTEVEPGSLTVVAFAPMRRADAPARLRRLRLF